MRAIETTEMTVDNDANCNFGIIDEVIYHILIIK